MEELYELLETSANACNNFIKCEMALNDGDVEGSQRYSKNGQTLVKALVRDTFLEVEELLEENDNQTNDYDYPNNFELLRFLNEITMHVGAYLSAGEDEKIKPIVAKNLMHAINTVKEIYLALYEN